MWRYDGRVSPREVLGINYDSREASNLAIVCVAQWVAGGQWQESVD